LYLGKSVTLLTIGALASVCIGVGVTNTGATGTTAQGASIATAAFVVTSFYQVWIGKKMKDFSVSSPQLLLNQAPISVLLLAILAPFFDTVPDIRDIPSDTLVALFLSGLAAASLVSFHPMLLRFLNQLLSESVTIPDHRTNERTDIQRRLQVSILSCPTGRPRPQSNTSQCQNHNHPFVWVDQ